MYISFKNEEMIASITRVNAHFDIRVLNRKKRIFEAFICSYPEDGIILEKGAIVSNIGGMLNIPLICNDNTLGHISHIIEFYEFLYIKGYFINDLEESLFSAMNSGMISHTLIEFLSHAEKIKRNVRHIFSMNILRFYIQAPQVSLLGKKSMIVHQTQMNIKNVC